MRDTKTNVHNVVTHLGISESCIRTSWIQSLQSTFHQANNWSFLSSIYSQNQLQWVSSLLKFTFLKRSGFKIIESETRTTNDETTVTWILYVSVLDHSVYDVLPCRCSDHHCSFPSHWDRRRHCCDHWKDQKYCSYSLTVNWYWKHGWTNMKSIPKHTHDDHTKCHARIFRTHQQTVHFTKNNSTNLDQSMDKQHAKGATTIVKLSN